MILLNKSPYKESVEYVEYGLWVWAMVFVTQGLSS
jgi:hypothetical protein